MVDLLQLTIQRVEASRRESLLGVGISAFQATLESKNSSVGGVGLQLA